jgi:predicted nucleotidyltransferase
MTSSALLRIPATRIGFRRRLEATGEIAHPNGAAAGSGGHRCATIRRWRPQHMDDERSVLRVDQAAASAGPDDVAAPAAPALDDVAAALAAEVVGIVRGVLGGEVVGAYLHGSAVLGGLRPSSDLDVLVVVARPTTDAQRRAIVARLLEMSGRRAYRGPARPVELTIVRASEVRPWHSPPTVDLLYGEWLRDGFERGEVPEPAPMPDLAPEIALTLQGDAALFGPPPAELLDPVPPADLRRAVVAGVPSLLADLETDTRNVLLTFARIWFTLETGIIGSKDQAAEWAIERLPEQHRGVLDRARELYLEGADDDWTPVMPAVLAHADVVVAEIERLQRSRSSSAPAT